MFWRLGHRALNKRRIIVGLKSDSSSRDMLLRLLHLVVEQGDSVLAVHVQQSDDDTFDPNTFHIYEDLCKSKQVDFEIKICTGSCYVTELSHQVRLTFATILAVGCSSKCAKSSTITKFLKALPPTCKLLIMDDGGKILFRAMGTSQQGSSSRVCRTLSESSSSSNQPRTLPPVRKSLSLPSSSTQENERAEFNSYIRRFTFEELKNTTDDFNPDMSIGESAHSRVYKAVLENGRLAAVKVLETSQYAESVFVREVEILSGLRHENIIRLIGYCYCKEMYTIVYDLLDSSLKQRLSQLKWSERIRLAIGVAKALECIHSCYPPIVHKDLSGFGSARVDFRSCVHKKPTHVTAFGYLAPEYIMYGKVDEKIDVYSYGVVLLELITGKEAFPTSPLSNQESLVVWARSLLICGLDERLIDPNLNENYNKDEMKAMVIAARLCLLHSSSRRPTMREILRFLEEPNYAWEVQKNKGDPLRQIGCKDVNSCPSEIVLMDDA
ncbi:proline-rich receptor-like protein kinase perk3 [Phtheirospermum japonicum]|uniref:Proline-rich receptor-like protein kinase perk3 n=1 Tax=Phtheirospermum japonicum TaxID=374723 RepID=A0A830DFJ1_9LAMI|nr:proline-rich receptor-like protein kinase perk3 [Phtheirospermum japonicum]